MPWAELRHHGRLVPRRRGKATISAEPLWAFVVGATESAFAAGITRMTSLPDVAITWRDGFKTEPPPGFPASAADHIGAHPNIISLLSHHEASHALWRAITGDAKNQVTSDGTRVPLDAGTLAKHWASTGLATCTTSLWLDRQPCLALHARNRESGI
jgi:hypothetical protein